MIQTVKQDTMVMHHCHGPDTAGEGNYITVVELYQDGRWIEPIINSIVHLECGPDGSTKEMLNQLEAICLKALEARETINNIEAARELLGDEYLPIKWR